MRQLRHLLARDLAMRRVESGAFDAPELNAVINAATRDALLLQIE